MVRMEEQVRELEAQLKDAYKGQIGNNQEVLKHVRENKELADKLRELEKKTLLYQDRLKEYEEILSRQQEEGDKKDELVKHLTAENEGLRKTNAFLEG